MIDLTEPQRAAVIDAARHYCRVRQDEARECTKMRMDDAAKLARESVVRLMEVLEMLGARR